MSTRSSTTKLVAPFSNPENVIRNHQRNRGEPSLLFDFEEINMDPNNNHGPPPAGRIPQNPAPDLRTMEELYQPTMLGRGGPIAPMTMQAMDIELKNHMIQQVQQSCQYYGLPRDDANKHIDKFLTVTQNMKQNGVPHDVLRLCLYPYSLARHATAWNDISNFRQLLDESLFEAWEHYKLSVDQCPNHNMLPVTKIDTFYNGLTLRHQDTINAAAGDIFMKRRPEECYDLIKNITAHYNDWDTSTLRGDQSNQQVNVVNPSCETYGGPHHYSECQAIGGFTQGDVYAATGNYNAGANQMIKIEKAFNKRPQSALPSNTIPNLREDIKVITTQSGITLAGPSVASPNPPSSSKELAPVSKSNEIPERNPHQTPIPYPLSFAEVLAQMPKYAKMLKDLLTNKEKLLELANTPLNENCSMVLLKKLLEKLGDPGKFLIPYDFSELEECLALADLGANINLMPLSVWKMLMLPELKHTRLTLELVNQSISYLVGIAEDVFVQVGKFTFLVDFVVVDYDVGPRVPLILGRPFLRTARALVDVHGEELTLRVSDEKLIFNVESTLKYPHKHGYESINQIDIIDTTCEDHFYKVLNVQKSIHPLIGSPTPSSDPVVVSLSPSLTPFGDNDFLLEETNAFLALDDSIPPEIDNGIYDSEGDILFLQKLLNDDPTKDLPPKELKNDETKMTKSSNEEPLELELKDLPPHLEYAFLKGTLKLPVIIAKDLKRKEKDQFNSHEDIDDLVPIPRNEESDESETETIMEEVKIHSSQSTTQIPPPYGKIPYDREDYRAALPSSAGKGDTLMLLPVTSQ
ncbi:reverse transcriptase domain-containing protein, partial [Tanacetum coccineum]